MGLEFYSIATKEEMFRITTAHLKYFESIFEQFNEKYDNLIDVYGDFRLYLNHLEFLISLLKKDKILLNDFKEGLLRVMTYCLENNITLFVSGD